MATLEITQWANVITGMTVTEGSRTDVPNSETLDTGAVQGRNNGNPIGYTSPCPPAGNPHRYYFTLYALDAKLNLKPCAIKQ